MTESAKVQKNAYQQQWEAMDERSRHAVRLVESAYLCLDALENGRTIAWLEELYAGISDPEMHFTQSEIEFAILAAMRARESVLKSLADKVYNKDGIAEALAKYQTEHAAIALEKLKDGSE